MIPTTCVFVVNCVEAIEAQSTTAMLIAGMHTRGHRVFLTAADQLSVDTADRVFARARRVGSDQSLAPAEHLVLTPGTLVIIRTNPARDLPGPVHLAALDLLTLARDQGVVVINDPDGLRRASSKLYTSRIPPALRPETLVTRDAASLRRFVEDSPGPSILKPLSGTRGADVFKVSADDPNLNQIIAVLTRVGVAIAQAFVPEAPEGDVRVLVLDGEVLRVGEATALVRRVPTGTDFRSNVHVGAVPVATAYTAALRRVVEAVAPLLANDGLALCGLDVIGTKVVEINVFAAGGLGDANAFYGVDFVAPVLDAFERRLTVSNAA